MPLFPIPPSPLHSFTQIPVCIKMTYVRLTSGDDFWFYPTSIERDLVSGYRWFGLFWSYFQFNPVYIASMECPPIPALY